MQATTKRKQLLAKRTCDIVVSALALTILWPVFAFAALAIRWTMGPPVLFRQLRPGWKGKLFVIYKFRTMHNRLDVHGRQLPDSERLTRLGRWMRHWSVDELPGLFNVLRGEMSLVGPRPLLVEYLDRYTAEQARRHELRPGLTGLSQVIGRNALPFSQRLAYDVWYVDHFGLLLDLKIILLTVLKTLTGSLFDGAGQDVAEVDDVGLHTGTVYIGDGTLEGYRKTA